MKTALTVAVVALILAGVSFATRGNDEAADPAAGLDACCMEDRETVLDEYSIADAPLATPVADAVSPAEPCAADGFAADAECADAKASECSAEKSGACSAEDAAACTPEKAAECKVAPEDCCAATDA